MRLISPGLRTTAQGSFKWQGDVEGLECLSGMGGISVKVILIRQVSACGRLNVKLELMEE